MALSQLGRTPGRRSSTVLPSRCTSMRFLVALREVDADLHCVMIPDLPGCRAVGRNPQQAMLYARRAIDEHCRMLAREGEPMPETLPPEQPHAAAGSVRGSDVDVGRSADRAVFRRTERRASFRESPYSAFDPRGARAYAARAMRITFELEPADIERFQAALREIAPHDALRRRSRRHRRDEIRARSSFGELRARLMCAGGSSKCSG